MKKSFSFMAKSIILLTTEVRGIVTCEILSLLAQCARLCVEYHITDLLWPGLDGGYQEVVPGGIMSRRVNGGDRHGAITRWVQPANVGPDLQ